MKLLPLAITGVESVRLNAVFSAYYDRSSERIRVLNLPANTKIVRLYNLSGQLLSEVQVYGNTALLEGVNASTSVYIVQTISSDGLSRSLKVAR